MKSQEIGMKPVTPILRIFDEEKAKEFYIGFLEFAVDWEHRFEDGFPLYMQISRGACLIHLSEHYGDCTPGSSIRIEVDSLETYHAALLGKAYKYARPGIENTPWGTREVRISDPFGNRITFYANEES
jgi:uncharacterized glyoxalase superfamily protein PhnB